MNALALYDRAAAIIPFVMAGYGGEMAVYDGANDDPVKSGNDALAGLGFAIDLCRGDPLLYARLHSAS